MIAASRSGCLPAHHAGHARPCQPASELVSPAPPPLQPARSPSSASPQQRGRVSSSHAAWPRREAAASRRTTRRSLRASTAASLRRSWWVEAALDRRFSCMATARSRLPTRWCRVLVLMGPAYGSAYTPSSLMVRRCRWRAARRTEPSPHRHHRAAPARPPGLRGCCARRRRACRGVGRECPRQATHGRPGEPVNPHPLPCQRRLPCRRDVRARLMCRPRSTRRQRLLRLVEQTHAPSLLVRARRRLHLKQQR